MLSQLIHLTRLKLMTTHLLLQAGNGDNLAGYAMIYCASGTAPFSVLPKSASVAPALVPLVINGDTGRIPPDDYTGERIKISSVVRVQRL